MIRIFVGYDHREAVAYHTFCQSVLERTGREVSFTPVRGPQLDGTNAFTYARFAVPEMCGFEGWALFVDGDMTCLADIGELWDLRDDSYAVQVVKHDYKTRYPVKYWGQRNYDYPRKNWSSVMLMNCKRWWPLGLAYFTKREDAYPHRFQMFDDRHIGALPLGWNWLALEQPYNPDAKLVHHTIGLPGRSAEAMDDPWQVEWYGSHARANRYYP